MKNKTTKTIVLTGSHHTPAIELIHQLTNDRLYNWKIIYITHHPGVIIPQLKISLYLINCGKFDRRFFPNNFSALPKTIIAFFQSLKLIHKLKPDIIVSFGAYTSVPVVVAGSLFRVPSITHEQTSTISLSTKINSFFVKKIALSFDDPKQLKKLPINKTIITGNLIRSDLSNNQSQKFGHLEKLLVTKPLIYITGGSQGSLVINQNLIKILPEILKTHTIIHQTGQTTYQMVLNQTQKLAHLPNYMITDYVTLEDIGWIFHHADIIISRSGANTCQEINIFNKKSILIPLPFTQQNEQELNALWLKKLHPDSTIIISQDSLTSKTLLQSIHKLVPLKTTGTVLPLTNTKLIELIHELL